MVSEATITDGDSFSVLPPHHARTRQSALLYSRKLASLLIAFAFTLLLGPPQLDAQTTPAPQNVQLSSSCLLTWDSVPEATHYRVFGRHWHTDCSSIFCETDYTGRYRLPARYTSYQVNSQVNSYSPAVTAYFAHWVRAYGPDGESAPSAEATTSCAYSVTTLRKLGTARNFRVVWTRSLPESLAGLPNWDQVPWIAHVSWDHVANATHYAVGYGSQSRNININCPSSSEFPNLIVHRDHSRPLNEVWIGVEFELDPSCSHKTYLRVRAERNRGSYGRFGDVSELEIVPGVDIIPKNSSPGPKNSSPGPESAQVVVSPEVTIAHNEAVIDEHGYAVTVPHGLGTIAFKALNPKDCGTIGNQAICDMDVLQVADVSGWAEQGIRFCFKGYGQVLFVPSHDADRQPIDQKTAQPETLPVEVDGEHVCVTINRDGKLFLIDAAPPTIITQTQQEPEPVWEPVPVTQCGHRTQADGSVVHVVQSGHHCWAIAEACGIYPEDIQRLNPGFGDCRMLHPGDELVVSAPPSPTDGVSMSVDEIPYDDPEYIAMEGRVSLGVARCMRDIAQDHRAVSFAMVKREARRIAEEAWRNRGSDHWTAQLGDGRLTVSRKLRRRTQGGGGLITIYSPVCTAMRPDLDFMYLQEDSESLAEESLEALRHAIADMLRVCEVRYAVAEREAEKIARAAFRDGVRVIDELPVYRAMGLGFRYTDSASSEKEAAKTECFGLPDDSYLTDWGDHGDKDQLYNEQQIEEAEAQLEAIKKWGVAACDIGLSLGTSGVAQAAGIASKEFAKEVTKVTLKEIAVVVAKEGAKEVSEAAVDEKAAAREQIAKDFRTKVIDLLPSGLCSAVLSIAEFNQVLDEFVQALAELDEGVDVEDLELFSEDIQCEIYSTNTVLAKRDPDPNKDASELRLNAVDTFSPLATVEHNGEKYYVVLGTKGRGTQVVGGAATAAVYNNTENHGHAFVPVSDIDATDSCKDLPDATSLYRSAARPQDLIGRELVDLNVQEVPDAFANEDCKFSMDIDPDATNAFNVYGIDTESNYVSFSVFTLCQTHKGTACFPVSDDNEFVITHYDSRNRRVYVKSLDDDGKPEGWLMTRNISQNFIGSGILRRADGLTQQMDHWVDPYHFNPENVVNETGGTRNFGNPAMCLPQQASE